MYKEIFTWLRENHKHPYVLVAGGLVLAVAGSVAGFSFANTGNLQASVAELELEAEGTTTEGSGDSVVGVVGDEIDTSASSGNSWAGTILSLGTVPVQPAREGNIVSWMVKIGDSVYAGQPIAKLSEPPAMPDLINMLATEEKMLAEKRAQAETTKQFTLKNNEQLKTQLAAFEKSANDSSALFSSASSQTGANARLSIEQANAAVAAMRAEIRSFLDQMVIVHVNTVTNTYVPALYRTGNLNSSYGQMDINTRNAFENDLFNLIEALKDKQSLPVDLAKKYLSSAVRLAYNTAYGEGVEDIREMMKDDQAEFLEMVSDYKDAEAEASMKATDYEAMNIEGKRMLVTDKRMIEEKIAENEKMLAMAEAEAKAAEASYATVLNGTKGGLYITAPLSGVVSTIDKNTGEFVEPGMPVARVTSRGADNAPFIRFRIPGNLRTPKAGEILKVVRPGFSQDIREIRVTGVGASLDTGGMYMADASFVKPATWPIDASVRVIAPDSSDGVTIKLSSIWWNQNGEPRVWAVSEAGRVYSKKVTLGRTLGTLVEVYEGLVIGDKYIIKPTPEITEDMSVETLVPVQSTQENDSEVPAKSSEHDNMPGM